MFCVVAFGALRQDRSQHQRPAQDVDSDDDGGVSANQRGPRFAARRFQSRLTPACAQYVDQAQRAAAIAQPGEGGSLGGRIVGAGIVRLPWVVCGGFADLSSMEHIVWCPLLRGAHSFAAVESADIRSRRATLIASCRLHVRIGLLFLLFRVLAPHVTGTKACTRRTTSYCSMSAWRLWSCRSPSRYTRSRPSTRDMCLGA